MRGRLEEELRALGVINAVVETLSAGLAGFLHPRGPAPQVSDAGGPDLLALDRWKQIVQAKRGEGVGGVLLQVPLTSSC